MVNLDKANDKAVWEFAHENGYVIVSKDVDFDEKSIIWGYPPKVIWIRRGNCSTKEIEWILRSHFSDIEELAGAGYKKTALACSKLAHLPGSPNGIAKRFF